MDRSLGILKSNSNRIFPIRGVSDAFDSIAGVVILSSILVGFWEVGGNIGSLSQIVENLVNQPQTLSLGLALFYLGIDTWTPTIPADFLPFPLNLARYLYPFTNGYLPHYSLESAFFALVTSLITTWLFLRLTDHEFWGWGLPVAILAFLIGWYLWTLVAWQLMFMGGEMIGFTPEQVYQIWSSSANATRPPALQYFFLATVPISFSYLVRHLI